MPTDNELEQHEQLIQLIREAIQHDEDLREKYQVGDKFRFVRDRLNGLLTEMETHLKSVRSEAHQVKSVGPSNKVQIYVYLYNTQGTILRSWAALLTPKVFYEHSVNRPIYTDRHAIETYIRSKSNKQQHAFITVSVNQEDILTQPDSAKHDTMGNPLIKVREGCLRFENFIVFTHNEHDYTMSPMGEFVKKS